MGFVFGIFLGAMGDMQPLQMVNGREVPQAPLREQVCVHTSVHLHTSYGLVRTDNTCACW